MAEKNTPESGNPVVAALKYVFGPLAKKSDTLPAPLAIGLPILVTIFLIAVLKDALPTNIAWLVGLAFVVPMAGYIAQLVLVRVDTHEKIGPIGHTAPPWAEIASPNPKDGRTDKAIKCRGSATGIPQNMHLWLAVEEDRRGQRLIWPKEGEVFVDEQGKWKHQIFEHGLVQHLSVSLWMANEEANAFIQGWLENGKRTGRYSKLNGISGATRLTSVDGLQLKQKEI
jgi:hypothetical protein